VTCGFDEKILFLYHDHELDPAAAARVEQHLEVCPDCRETLLALQALRSGLSEACSLQKAPDSLRERVRLSLNSDEASNKVELGLAEKFKLFFTNNRRVQVMAAGLAMAALIIFILLPSGSQLGRISPTLAAEHMAGPMVNHAEFQSTSADEIEAYYLQNFGIDVTLPKRLGKDIDLDCGCLIYIKGKPAIHAYYKKGALQYSLFIMYPVLTPGGDQRSQMVGGRMYDFDKKDDINMVCWKQNRLVYVLAGCCPYDELVNLSLASI
jgi:mycothiol system anti-sigma-R factor